MIEAVAGAVGEQGHAGRQAAELAVARRLLALGDALLHEFASLEHLERAETVDRRERGVAGVVGDGSCCRHPGGSLVLDRGDDLVALEDLPGREMCAASACHISRPEDVERALELRREVVLQQPPGLLGRSSRWRFACPCPLATSP